MVNGAFCQETAGIWRFVGYIIYIIRIAIPIIIILLGTLDLGKAVIAGEDKKIKDAQKAFIMRIVYGVAIFFVFPIVETVFSLLGADIKSGNAKVCYTCAKKPNGEVCRAYLEKLGIDPDVNITIGDDDEIEKEKTENNKTYNREEL